MRSGRFSNHSCLPSSLVDAPRAIRGARSSTRSCMWCAAGTSGGACRTICRRGRPPCTPFGSGATMGRGSRSTRRCVSAADDGWDARRPPAPRLWTVRPSRPVKRGPSGLRRASAGEGAPAPCGGGYPRVRAHGRGLRRRCAGPCRSVQERAGACRSVTGRVCSRTRCGCMARSSRASRWSGRMWPSAMQKWMGENVVRWAV
jgi:hypothetical protein